MASNAANEANDPKILLPYGWDTIVVDIDWADPTARGLVMHNRDVRARGEHQTRLSGWRTPESHRSCEDEPDRAAARGPRPGRIGARIGGPLTRWPGRGG